MGTVYLGSDSERRRVAVKVIRAEYADDAGFRARFHDEVAAARRVARFCTAPVLDAGIEGGRAYVVTEYVDGPSLAGAVTTGGPLHGSTLDGVAIGVAAALHGIHTAGIVHRDLKPSNVLLSRVGPKVIDFGIAKAIGALDGSTLPGLVVGTPGYVAPERYTGERATPAADIFAWGAVVAYAGTGRCPFGDGPDLARRVIEDEPDLRGLDASLRDLVVAALSKHPHARPTAQSLLLRLVGGADDTAAIAEHRLAVSWPSTLHERISRRGRRRVRTAALALLTLVIGALFTGSEQIRRAASVAGTPPTTTQRVEVGQRVPTDGTTAVAPHGIDSFRFEIPPGHHVYLEGLAESCSHLVPWMLTSADGARVASGRLCGSYGPMDLSRGGEYELRLGGDPAGGRYAFRLVYG